MIKTFPLLLLAAALLLPAAAVRAQEDEEQAEAPAAQKAPAAASAARNKGYQAEEEKPAAHDEDEPSAPSAAPVPRYAPRSPGIGQGPASFSRRPGEAAGGGTSPAGGLSCEKTVPRLTKVHRVTLPKLECLNGRVFDYGMLPDEAISYQFTAPKSGSGGFYLNEATNFPTTNMMATISEIPCDFDVSEGANANGVVAQSCRSARVFPNVSFKVGGGGGKVAGGCPLKAGKTYYYNIRFLGIEGKPAAFYDACAAQNRQFPGAKDQRCGGIFSATANVGDVVDGAACGVIKRGQFLP